MPRSDLSSLLRRLKDHATALESFDDSYRALTEDYHANFDMVVCSDQFAYTAESKKPGSFTLECADPALLCQHVLSHCPKLAEKWIRPLQSHPCTTAWYKIGSYSHMSDGCPLCSHCLQQRYLLSAYGKGNQQAFGFGKAGKGARGKERGSNDGALQGDGWLEHLGAPGLNQHVGKRFNDYGHQGFVDNGNNGAASSNGSGNTVETIWMWYVTQIMQVVSRQEGEIQEIKEALASQASILESIQSSLAQLTNATTTQNNSCSSSGAESWEKDLQP